ncbi:unnamed protein product [Clonostachys solani]|uniref:Uncharacterized protein n=1 Tax=Clonostachys solani TaxID=160281 RepID=A0A9P0ESX2_9HYPO|nr:unnamed protein product [Clonostachys solani]
MRFFYSVILLAVTAVVSAASIKQDMDLLKREIDAAAVFGQVEIVPVPLDGNLTKLEFTVDGNFEGTLIETEDGGVEAFDAEGKPIDLDDTVFDEFLENVSISKRFYLAIIRILGALLVRWGKRAWAFFACIGWNATLLNCADKFVTCASRGTAPWACASGLLCVGKAGKNCV